MGRINCTKRAPNDLKNADVTPSFKKDNPVLAKEKKRPVSVLSTVFKNIWKNKAKQIIDYINQYIFPLLCGYKKGFSKQTALSHFFKNWKFIFRCYTDGSF